jgi:dephospho-CoA kinase
MRAKVPVIGIAGGVGAGKSSVVKGVRGLRLQIVDADQAGHQELRKPEIRDQLLRVFGTEIAAQDGEIDRKRLAMLVFGESTEHNERREQLNQIVRPGIRDEIRRQITTAPQDVDAIILDAALLLEAGWAAECDALIFIETPLEIRRQRVARDRGWSAEELQKRESSQWSLDRKKVACHYVVDNSGTPEDSARQMAQHLRTILELHGCN